MINADVILAAVVSSIAWLGAVSDLRTGKIPNNLTYPAMLAGFVCWAVLGLAGVGTEAGLDGLWQGLGWSVGGWLVAVVPFLLLIRIGLGGGDMKLLAVAGAWLASWQGVVAVMGYAVAVSLIWAVVVIIQKRIVVRTFWHVLASLWMRRSGVKDGPTPSGKQVPFAVGIAVGTTLVLIEAWIGRVPGGLVNGW